MTESRAADHFARLYRANPDPWSFETSGYERAKYQQTLSVLDDRRFSAALEVGCSIGMLTALLAPRCDMLLGVDIVDDPLPAARARCADQPHVRFQRMQVPAEWPAEKFDLVVLSEVLYFLTPADIERCAEHVVAGLLPDAMVILVNWLGRTDDPTSGDAAADRFIAAARGPLTTALQSRHSGYRLDVLKSA
jgi:2-polyprenyl-3-methyl-5-hydroxy-6-metoxy-1,4-benzoquinol methylase